MTSTTVSKTAQEIRLELGSTKSELTWLERNIANRPPLIDNAHLHDPRAIELRAKIPALKTQLVAAIVHEETAKRLKAERELREIAPQAQAARDLLAGDGMDVTRRQILAAETTIADESEIRRRMDEATARAHGAAEQVRAL